jgi:DNA-binding beta-propeller fold protein YncE
MRAAGVVAAVTCALAAALLVVQASAADSEAGEVWVTSQGTHRLFIVHGLHGQGGLETVDMPAGTGPHLINFSPDGEYAYISGMGNGNLLVVRGDDRRIVATLNFGTAAGTHQAMPSPDGDELLVAQIPSKRLIKVAADEGSETWTPTGQELTLDKSPICTIFRDDGERAYVSLLPSGIQAVDVATMTKVGDEIPTDGFVACGMVKQHDGKGILLASTDGGGHVYRLDFATETLESRGTLGASDWHSFRVHPNEKLGFGSVPTGDEVRLVDLESDPVNSVALPLDATPGEDNDEPDHMAVRGNILYATLRESGKLAIVDVNQRTVDYLQLSPANPFFTPANCAGCAVHGVAVRP